jgi:hypothetical protein
MDNNDLARFLDHTLAEEEHGRAVTHLSVSDEDAELLADAAYMLRELEAEDGTVADDGEDTSHPHGDAADTGTDAKVIPLRPPSTARTRPRRVPVRWLALAAVLAGVLLVPLALSRSRGPAGPGEFAALLTSRDAGLSADWVNRPPWRATRGNASVAERNALSARVGATNVDLDVAIQARQAEQTVVLAERIAEWLERSPESGAAFAARYYREIAASASEEPKQLATSLAEARKFEAGVLDEDYMSLGAWAEAARIAAERRDAPFFHARASQKMLDRAASLPSLGEDSRPLIEAIRAAAQADQPDWTVLSEKTRELLSQIGG